MLKTWKMIETLANGYKWANELSNEYQHDRVWMFFKNLCILVLWTKVASALKGLIAGIFPTILTFSPYLPTLLVLAVTHALVASPVIGQAGRAVLNIDVIGAPSRHAVTVLGHVAYCDGVTTDMPAVQHRAVTATRARATVGPRSQHAGLRVTAGVVTRTFLKKVGQCYKKVGQ